MRIENFTELRRVEAFILAKCAHIATDGLSIHIKHTRARRRDVTGYYRFADRRIVIAVKRRLRYPRDAAYGVGSITVERKSPRARPFKLVWHKERFDSPEDLLAFVAGHEIWHFLCHSGQRKGDHETKANCNGFLWLREFKQWTGAGCVVAPVPPLPPRPDLAPRLITPAVAAPTAAALAALIVRSTSTPSPQTAAQASPAAQRAAPGRGVLAGVMVAARAWVQGDLFSRGAGGTAAAPPPRPSRPRRGSRPRSD